MDNLKYLSFTKFKENTFFKFVKNDIYISSGVNQFEILDLYKELMNIEIYNQNTISTYAEAKGNQILIDVLSYYENYLFQEMICGYKYKLCMVAGATAGLNIIFDYLSMQGIKHGLIIGYSYNLFAVLAQRYGIKLEVLISDELNKIVPNISEIAYMIEKTKPKFVCLTEPLNPSGEMYSELEFRQLLRICKKYNCFLIIDKCQRDELQNINKRNYFPINKIINEEDLLDNVIFVNSLSKTRCLPGLRVGYVIGNKKIMNYVEYMNTISYWHSCSCCSLAVAIDVLYQLIFLESNSKELYINDIRSMLQYSLRDVLIAKEIFEYINIKTIEEKAKIHCQAIMRRYEIIYSNYLLVKKYALKKGYEITTLDGGYNFCIKVTCFWGEKGLKKYASEKYKLELFTQEDFCCKTKGDYSFWLRISCAECAKTFEKKFELLSSILSEIC